MKDSMFTFKTKLIVHCFLFVRNHAIYIRYKRGEKIVGEDNNLFRLRIVELLDELRDVVTY